MMGSSDSEKDWAAKHGASPQSVADEGPQHRVALRSFALGKYEVIRAECPAFVRETGHLPGDECGKDSLKWNEQLLVVSRVASSISHEKRNPADFRDVIMEFRVARTLR
jgi:formylglycine-generating enzyme required for sulfatase activity